MTKAVKRFDPYQTADKKISMEWDLATSPVAKVVRTQRPLIIADAMKTIEHPTFREDARVRGYRTTVILPLLATDSENRPMVLSVQSRARVDVSQRELSFLRMVGDFASIAVEKAVRLIAARKTSARLHGLVDAYTGIMQPIIEGATLSTLSGELNRVLDQPWLVVDLTTHEIFSGKPPKQFPRGAAHWQKWIDAEGKRQFLTWSRALDVHGKAEKRKTLSLRVDTESVPCDARIFPLLVDGETVGALYLFTGTDEMDNLYLLHIQTVRLVLSVALMRSVIGFRSAVAIQDEVVRRLLAGEWDNPGDFVAHASSAGIMLNQPSQVLMVAGAGQWQEDMSRLQLKRSLQLTARLARDLFHAYATVQQDGIIISLLPACNHNATSFSDNVRRLQSAIELNTSKKWILIFSDYCENLTQFSHAHRRCRRFIALARSLGLSGLVSAEQFGSLPLLLSMADNIMVEEFFDHTICRVTRASPKRSRENLQTLRAFVDCEGRFKACAEKLNIHVSTLRYRIDKINERCGVDATCAATRFDLQIAFRLHDISKATDSGDKHFSRVL